MKGTKEIIVGIVFFGVLFVLGFFTILLGEFSFGSGMELAVQFDEVSGLEKGNNVLVAGYRLGKVRDVQYITETGKVMVHIQLRKSIPLWEDYCIMIKEATLLGGLVVRVDPGREKVSVEGQEVVHSKADLTRLRGLCTGSPLEGLQTVVDENREDIRTLIHGLKKIVGELEENDTASKLDRAIESLANVGNSLAAGEGTLGRLITEDGLYNRAEAFFASGEDLLGTLKEGKGILPRLFRDEELAQKVDNAIGDFEGAVANINLLTQDVRQGKGTLGKLFVDDTLHDQMEGFLASGNELFQNIREGEGLLPRLLNDAALAQKAERVVTNLEDISTRIQQGEGTLGKLIARDELHDELLYALKQIGGAVEDTRESAPIAVFASALFSVF